MNIFLVRHGESESNVDDTLYRHKPDHSFGLTKRGTDQARASGYALKGWWNSSARFDDRFWDGESHIRVWTSPYRRTRETTQAFVNAFGYQDTLDIREHTLLVEQQYGLFDGLPDDERKSMYPNEHAHYTKCEQMSGRFWARMPLGESRFDVAQRVHQAFGTFHRDAKKHGIKNIIVVSHGTAIRAFVMMWLHLPYEWFESEPNPKNGSIRLIAGGSDMGYIHEGG